MNELALFSGAGGGILGGKLLGWRTVCAVEKDEYCQRVLEQRIRDGHLPEFPIWDDVRTFDGRPWRGKVDIITAGFPCQPFSTAGKRKAENDERNMWPDTIRIIRDVGPAFVFLENVPSLRCPQRKKTETKAAYFGRILSDLAECGFDAEWGVLGAGDVGADHSRKRVWILASVSDTCKQRLSRLQMLPEVAGKIGEWWPWNKIESLALSPRERRLGTLANIPRENDGLASRVDRLKAVGNGQVPAVAATAFSILCERIRVGPGQGEE